MTKKSDDIEWGPWFMGTGQNPYQYKDPEPIQSIDGFGGIKSALTCPQIIRVCWPEWRPNRIYRLPADHPHYTPEGQLYYLKQQFPDVAWVQALEAPEAPEPVDPVLLKAREIYMRRHYSFRPDVCDGSWDHTHEMKLIIEGIKAGMEMKK